MSSIPSTCSSTTVSAALAPAITFLTRPLTPTITPARFITLQHALSTILTPYLSSSWSPSDPNRDSGRRCLTLSPLCTPPKPIFTAATQAGIEWRMWMSALGGREFGLSSTPAAFGSASPALPSTDSCRRLLPPSSPPPLCLLSRTISTPRRRLV
jgi:hypothetical protein